MLLVEHSVICHTLASWSAQAISHHSAAIHPRKFILVPVTSPTRGRATAATARLGGNGCGSINVFCKEKNGGILENW